MGHCLWSGIIDERDAGPVAEHLMSEQMFNGWGVRTLASDMGLYNPVSYHNGSVWPHDNAIIAAGLMRYGFVDEARRITSGLLDAAERFEGRLPELFCGFSRDEHATPVPYPRACRPRHGRRRRRCIWSEPCCASIRKSRRALSGSLRHCPPNSAVSTCRTS